MTAANIFAYITAAIYFLLGVGFLINPAGMAGGVGFKNLGSEALIDVRATYGGFLLVIGLLLAYWTYVGEIKTAITFTLISFVGFFLGRVIGLFAERGNDWGAHLFWAKFELVYIVISLYFFKNLK